MKLYLFPLVSLVFLGSCASPPKPHEATLTAQPEKPSPFERVDGAITEVMRVDVARVVDAGMGKFLQDAEFEVVYTEGKYVGFRIVRIVNTERYRGVGIEAGDIITRVNGASVEREGEAYEVFRSLRSAPRIEIDYVRSGEPMRISLPIVGDAPPPPAAGAASPSTGAAAGGTPAGAIPAAPVKAPGSNEKLVLPAEKPADAPKTDRAAKSAKPKASSSD